MVSGTFCLSRDGIQVEILRCVPSGLGHDNKAYFYTGGTALGNQAGSATSNKSVHLMVDTRKIDTYENQRWNPVSGFSDIGKSLIG